MPLGAPSFAEALRAGAEIFHALRGILKKARPFDGRRRRRRLRAEPQIESRSGRSRARSDRQGRAPGRQRRVHRARRRVERTLGRRRQVRVQEIGRARPARPTRWSRSTRTGCGSIRSSRSKTASPKATGTGWKLLTRGARRPRAAGRRRCVRDQPGDPAQGHRRRRRQRAARQVESDRHRHRNARRGRAWRATRATRRSSRTDRARPRTATIADLAVGTAAGQIKTGSASRTRSRLQVQPAAADRRGARRSGRYAGRSRDPTAGVADRDERRVMMLRVVLLRHGESTWNQENRFTGWTDVDLTERGRRRGARGRPAADAKAATCSTSPTRRC